jgi:hypothetical protein
MAWWNPKSWFKPKAAPDEPPAEAPPSPIPGPYPPIPDGVPCLWVRLNPAHPFQGFDHYLEAAENPFPTALLVLHLTSDEARLNLVGKVLDWTRLSPTQLDDLEKRNAFAIEYADLVRMFR